MRIGLLWFDDDKGRPLNEKVTQAARRYRERFGQSPTICYVHPEEAGAELRVGTVTVRPLRTVLRHHFWVGVEEQAAEQLSPAA
jgi:hypothetical protein